MVKRYRSLQGMTSFLPALPDWLAGTIVMKAWEVSRQMTPDREAHSPASSRFSTAAARVDSGSPSPLLTAAKALKDG